MSTILKALRRLEEEKAASEEPRPLREQIATPPRGPLRARRNGWFAAVVALVLGVATGGGAIWWLFGDASQTKTEVAAVTPAPVTPVAPPVPAPAEPPQAVMPGPPDQAFASDVETIDRPEALPRLADTDPVQPGPIQPKPGSHRPVEFSAAAERARQAALAEYNAAERARRGLPPEVAAASPPAPAEPVAGPGSLPVAAEPARPAPIAPEPTVLAPPTPPARVAAEPPAPAPVPTPALAPAAEPAPQIAASPAPKAAPAKPAAKPVAPKAKPAPEPPPPSIPVAVEKTQWHPLADRRIAWLRVPGESEPHRVVEGDIVDGLIVSAIEPSGVVFERDGEKIRRALGK